MASEAKIIHYEYSANKVVTEEFTEEMKSVNKKINKFATDPYPEIAS